MMNKQIIISPDMQKLDVTGITLSDIEMALNNNNVDPGSMVVRMGIMSTWSAFLCLAYVGRYS